MQPLSLPHQTHHCLSFLSERSRHQMNALVAVSFRGACSARITPDAPGFHCVHCSNFPRMSPIWYWLCAILQGVEKSHSSGFLCPVAQSYLLPLPLPHHQQKEEDPAVFPRLLPSPPSDPSAVTVVEWKALELFFWDPITATVTMPNVFNYKPLKWG